MATSNSVDLVVEAFAKIGVDLTEAHRAELVQMIENVADPDAKAIMDSLAEHIVLHGLAGAFQSAARNDITSSENDIIGVINSNIAGGVDALDAWLRKVAGEAPRR